MCLQQAGGLVWFSVISTLRVWADSPVPRCRASARLLRQPASHRPLAILRHGDDLAFAFKRFSFDSGDSGGHFKLRGRVEGGNKPPRHHVKNLHLELIGGFFVETRSE